MDNELEFCKETHDEFYKSYNEFVNVKEKYFKLQLVCQHTYGKKLTKLFIELNRDIKWEDKMHKLLCLSSELVSIPICQEMSRYFDEMYNKLKKAMHQYCVDLKG